MAGCCDVERDGAAASAAAAAGVEPFDASRSDATLVVVPIANLAAVGASATFHVRLSGHETNGQRGLYFAFEGAASRNAVGPGFVTPIFVGPVGFTDAVLVSWSTLGVPAGWGAFVALVGNVLTVQFGTGAATLSAWAGWQIRRLYLGALPA